MALAPKRSKRRRKPLSAEAQAVFDNRPSGLMVNELPAAEWDEMYAVIALMEGETRADIVMKECTKLA